MLLLHGVPHVLVPRTLISQVCILAALEAPERFPIFSHWIFTTEMSASVLAFSSAFVMSLKVHLVSLVAVVEIVPVKAAIAKVLMSWLSIFGMAPADKPLLESGLPCWFLVVSSMHPLRHHVI